MHSQRDTIEIMDNDEADEVIEELQKKIKIIKKWLKNWWKVVNLYSIMFIYCIINVIK